MPSSTAGKRCGFINLSRLKSTGSDLTVELSVAEGDDPPASHGFTGIYFTYQSKWLSFKDEWKALKHNPGFLTGWH